MKLSLIARTSLITALLLSVCVAAGCIVIYSKVHKGLREELEAQCAGRIGVLRSLVEVDDGRLVVDNNQPQLLEQEQWRVTTMDDQVLWSFGWNPDSDAISRSQQVVLGAGSGVLTRPEHLDKTRVDDKSEYSGHDAYLLPAKDARIALKIVARVSREHMNSVLRRLAIVLATVGPLLVLVAALLMALFLRWQLRPLGAMAHEAALIGPENPTTRIGPAGTSTECVLLRASINRMIERLELGLARERQFAAVAAHELRSPLAQLRTSLEVTLRKERDSAEYRQAIEEGLSDIRRLQALTANLLLITRGFDAGQQQEAVTPVRAAFERARRECNSDAVLEQEAATDGGVLVRGREELLVAALRNVLENAVRYAPGAPARVAVNRGAGEVRIVVRDSGPGVPPDDRERIFDPLIRLDAARTIKDETHGFGLGLTVARAAVRACGGDLVCCPRADGNAGAEFVFLFRPAPVDSVAAGA